MKAIIKILVSIICISTIVWSCESEQINGEIIYDGPAFLRFYLNTNSNGEPVGSDDLEIGKEPVEEYDCFFIKPLEIPVSLSYSNLDKDINAEFTVTSTGNFDKFSIAPINTLNFGAGKLMDTITISFLQRWDPAQENMIELELVSCSDNSVNLGHLNDFKKNNILTIKLGNVLTTYSFSTNRIEINGQAGEEIEFEVLFDNGFIPQEIEDLELFSEVKGFDYTLEKIFEEGNFESIKYIMTLNEAIDKDEVSYITTLALNEGVLYEPTGNTMLQIVKPLNILRDNAAFTASNFYNLNDPYNRMYGENWMDYNSEPGCDWVAWNAFCYPVVVSEDHPNAILYSDNGTEDESDDIYHHAFRVGFYSPNAGRTTNSFNLKRWFNNDYGDEDKSPGFNVREALEFYPKDGNSETEGTVLVIPQLLTISNKSDKSYILSISGEGTYKEISPGLFEIILIFRVYNEELFGGTQVSYYRMYNSNNYGGHPEDLTEGCIEIVDL